MQMKNITKYKNTEECRVIDLVPIIEILRIIKEGDNHQTYIELARNYEKGTDAYADLKDRMIPSFRFNFLFEKRATNANITEPTGLIYLDADYLQEIPESEYVFAKWKSVSETGFSVLVKVDGLTLTNISSVYDQISRAIGVDFDINARKATQQTVQSHDKDLYHNPNSKVFNCQESNTVSSPIKLKKEKRYIIANDTFKSDEELTKVRFNNIDDYFKEEHSDKVYRIFRDEKINICNPFVPLIVTQGNRNKTLFIYLSQITMLNRSIHKNYLLELGKGININVMIPKLSDAEMLKVIGSVAKKNKEDTLEIYFNQERRVLFNPLMKLPFKEKMSIVNKELGAMKSEKTKETIYVLIEDWGFEVEGKITQKKAARITGFSVSTIKRHWHHFKPYVWELNNDYKVNTLSTELGLKKPPSINESETTHGCKLQGKVITLSNSNEENDLLSA
jgi:hypothetical protein